MTLCVEQPEPSGFWQHVPNVGADRLKSFDNELVNPVRCLGVLQHQDISVGLKTSPSTT